VRVPGLHATAVGEPHVGRAAVGTQAVQGQPGQRGGAPQRPEHHRERESADDPADGAKQDAAVYSAR